MQILDKNLMDPFEHCKHAPKKHQSTIKPNVSLFCRSKELINETYETEIDSKELKDECKSKT